MQSNLIARETTYEMFIQKLAEGKINGIDIAILAICELFNISIIVLLLLNYLWKSDEIPLDDFYICLIVFSKGKSLATTVQCLKLSQYMGAQTGTCQKSAVGHSRKCKVGNVRAELGDHNYSANIEDHDILNGSNSSCILGV